jgi:serine/threonine-protein kinase
MIGQGGVASVYEAIDQVSGDLVAVKMLQLRYSDHEDRDERIQSIDRFLREAEIAKRWSDPSACATPKLGLARLIRVLDQGMDAAGAPYMVMELLRGLDLHQLLKLKGSFSFQETLFYGVRVCQALEVAHRLGVIHRDLKPSNIFVDELANEVVLFDFGVCYPLDGRRRLTPHRGIVGTLPSIPPESLRDPSREPDPRYDVYSTGILLYRMAVGRPPYWGTNPHELMVQVFMANPKPISQEGFPPEFGNVVFRCLAPIEKRYQSIATVRDALLLLPGCPDLRFAPSLAKAR